MSERVTRERDILVASNEYSYVQDLTKGDIVLYVGPTKISLSNTERLVEFRCGRFVPVKGEEGSFGVYPFVLASSSQYVVLENPPRDQTVKPVKGSNSAIELLTGKKFIVPGPVTFPLWPGQKADIIDGHKLRENEYLVVRVYDKIEGDEKPIGTEMIIRGSEISFYIPRTGLEVVPDGKGSYVRSAVTLLDGEYCILQSPNGRRKYVRGPAVVFPEPMEDFVRCDDEEAFKAHHLKKNMGIHIRVVKDLEAGREDQVPAGSYIAGQELFIRDREGFFFPTEYLEAIGEVHAIPIAEKEGIYVRHIETGEIFTEIGPKNYLPDPTRVDVIDRALTPEIARLYGLVSYDPEKAVSIYIPPSYAILVTAKNKREVVKGPQTRIINYDEDLEILQLSTGKPKTDETLLSTCFLQTEGNKVSDIIRVRTRDHVELDVTLSYRVSFESRTGEAGNEKWFNVKNYVALLCDHLGSIVRAAVRAVSIETLHSNSTELIRSGILGEKHGEEKRAGRRFTENDLWVYDVEVLEVKILDADVKKLLSDAQRNAIASEVNRKQEELRLESEKQREDVNQQIYQAQIASLGKEVELEGARRSLSEAKVQATVELDRIEKVGHAANEAKALEISTQARIEAAGKEVEVQALDLNSRVTAFKEQMAALQPELITTLNVLGNQQLASELVKSLSPLAILGGESVADVLERLLKSLPVGLDAAGLKKALHGQGKGADK